MNQKTCHVGIDPGAKGGIAWRDPSGVVRAENMPAGRTAQIARLRALRAEFRSARREMAVTIEQVGFHIKGNSAMASVTFARHCEALETILEVLGIPTELIQPKRWQRMFGKLPRDKKDRKNTIKKMMLRRFPHLKVTLNTADALALLVWGEAMK